jgi:hypothetical protein
MYVKTSQFFRMPDAVTSDVSTDPAAQWFFHIVTKGASLGDTIRYDVKLQYYVQFYDRKPQTLD